MRISIVVPSFNQARFLEVALDSLVSQSYVDKEIIVLDGGSTDGSVDVIRKYQRHLAAWKSESDGGQSRAIAAGLEMATGQIIGWLNSDDTLAEGALERLARIAGRTGQNCVFHGGFEVIDELGEVQEVFWPRLTPSWIARAIGPAICQPGAFFGRDVYIRVGGLDRSLKYAMDFDLWMRFVACDVQFVRIPHIQGQFRRHPLQKGHSLEWLKHCDEEAIAIERRYSMAARGSVRRLVARQVQRAITLTAGQLYRTWAHRAFRHGRLREFAVTYST